MSVPEMAVRFVLGHPHVTSAILGYSEPAHVDAAVAALEAGPLPDDVLKMLEIQGLDEES
jgi:aryl-alcohol dehydrogenase-like predicted oxidoreductase